MSQEHKNKAASKQDEEVSAVEPEGQERRKEMSDAIDDLLEDIDDVLETNAEEFIRSYVQGGGQ